jgi:hypothetical protein
MAFLFKNLTAVKGKGYLPVVPLLVLSIMLFSGSTSAFAHDSHVGNKSIFSEDVVSPGMHCPLHKKMQLNHLCPHANGNRADTVLRIGPECGGNPLGQIPASNIFQNSPYIISSFDLTNEGSAKLRAELFLFLYHNPDSDRLTPPPKPLV